MRSIVAAILLTWMPLLGSAVEYHVSLAGNDSAAGTREAPLRTISAAALLAEPGDTVTVHEGVYRERVNPPRGGTSDEERIVYRAEPGEPVVIKGSEVVKGWERTEHDTWRVEIPNAFFGGFNPYTDRIQGDWFDPKGREHHTGAVYREGHWLTEAVSLADVLAPVGAASANYGPGGQGYLLNLAWVQPGNANSLDERIPSASFAEQRGVQTAACSEGGECVGWIEHGDWVRYERVDFGQRAESIKIRAASATAGGIIQLRLDGPNGDLLGTCAVPNTGGWQSWRTFEPVIRPVSGLHDLCLVFQSDAPKATDVRLWYARVDDENTTIWAQFDGLDPNKADVEINVRQSVFYPEQPGVNFITVRGFALMHAATPWAPPTAEQVGLIGTHWSKGWIIEDNEIAYSTCVGVTLGKYGDQWDNTSQNTATGYVETINRALENGWTEENIGHHVVRNNHIAHCEQAGIVGSLGAVYSTIAGNDIHDIHVRQLFGGAEMAGIKLHAAIDTAIERNHIHRTVRGIWLDWMAQGARVTRNLLHDNGPAEDLFFEVNHGPYLVDNNLLLSATSLLDMSEGGAYAHNLFTGRVVPMAELRRETPFHVGHKTDVAGLMNIQGGDNRFYNNIFAGGDGLARYDQATRPLQLGGNLFLNGAQPARIEKDPAVRPDFDPKVTLDVNATAIVLGITLDDACLDVRCPPVTTALLGKAVVPDLPYEEPDGSPITVDTDYLGRPRNLNAPTPGPFEQSIPGRVEALVWEFARD